MRKAYKLTSGLLAGSFHYERQFRKCVILFCVRHLFPCPSASCCRSLRVDSLSATGVNPSTPLLWNGPTAAPPYCFLASSACQQLSESGAALPSSDSRHSFACHGLRP